MLRVWQAVVPVQPHILRVLVAARAVAGGIFAVTLHRVVTKHIRWSATGDALLAAISTSADNRKRITDLDVLAGHQLENLKLDFLARPLAKMLMEMLSL